MANFCGNCGFALSGSPGFCPQCGARTGAPAAAPPAPAQMAPPPAAPPPPRSSGGSFGKILLAVFGIFLMLGLAGAFGFYYFVARPIKHKYDQVKQRIETEAGVTRASRDSGEQTGFDACTLLSSSEASDLLKVPIDRAVLSSSGGDASCEYFRKAGAADDSQNRIREDLERLKQRKSSGGPPPEEVKNLAKELGGALAAAQGTADTSPYFGITVQRGNGGMLYKSFRGANTILGVGVPHSGSQISGLGDEAFFGPMDSMLAFRKGETSVILMLQRVPDGHDKGIAIAHKVLDRI